MSQALKGHPSKTNGSWCKVLTKHGLLEKNGKSLWHSCLENSMHSMERQKDMTLKDEPPRSVSVQYPTGEQWTNSSRRNGEAESKPK